LVRRPLKIISFTILALAILALICVGPVDDDVVADGQLREKMDTRLAGMRPFVTMGNLEAGWSRVNITPNYPMPMAGYAPRKSFEAVHDSLYARVLSLKNNGAPVSFISVDLLLFPPMLRDRLREKLDSASITHLLYLSATHTHNGIGGWDNSLVGKSTMGTFHKAWLETTANNLLLALINMTHKPAEINYWQSDASEMVENRVDPQQGKTDGIIRGIEIARSDSSKAILYTFSAHPTSIDHRNLELSGDYPAAVTKLLTRKFDFPMFMAGMVGSHRLKEMQQTDYPLLDAVAPMIESKVNNRLKDSVLRTTSIRFLSVPIEFGPSQLRVAGDWRANDWIFRSALRPLKGDATMVEIGNIVLIGMPCDFSGELYNVQGLGELAESNGKHLIITSFNGDYVGYITLDRHYYTSHAEEIRALNWVGPGYGEYFSAIIRNLVAGTPVTSNN
jgi:neutral ceramidase